MAFIAHYIARYIHDGGGNLLPSKIYSIRIQFEARIAICRASAIDGDGLTACDRELFTNTWI